jgi:hypothetical protein
MGIALLLCLPFALLGLLILGAWIYSAVCKGLGNWEGEDF